MKIHEHMNFFFRFFHKCMNGTTTWLMLKNHEYMTKRQIHEITALKQEQATLMHDRHKTKTKIRLIFNYLAFVGWACLMLHYIEHISVLI